MPELKTHLDKVAALSALLTLLGLTFWIGSNATDDATRTARQRFDFRVNEVRSAIRQRLQAYEHALRGGAGLFAASEHVSRHEWRTYVGNLAIDKHYPGIRGIGFSLRIPPGKMEAHLRAVRAEGFPEYAVKPAGERPEYTAIIYLEPFDWRNQRAFGYDMFSEPVRRAAMERARDTGMTAVSGKVTLVQETREGIQHGFLMYLPIYPNGIVPPTLQEKRAALVGYVYSPFRMNDLMRGILGDDALPDIDLEIFDGNNVSPETLMYDSVIGRPAHPAFTATVPIDLDGHRWLLRFSSLPAFDAGIDRRFPVLIQAAGIVIGFLFALVVWSLMNSRRNARALAGFNRGLQAEVTERKRMEDRFRGILESAADGIIITDEQGRITIVNARAASLFGYARQELLGQPVEVLIPERLHTVHLGHRQEYHAQPRTRMMGVCAGIPARRKDGTEFPVDVSLSVLHADASGMDGRLVISVVRDITERIHAETELKRINRTLRLLSQCNGVLVQAGREAELLEAICRRIVDVGGYRLAWVGLVRQSAGNSVQPAACAGTETGLVEEAHFTWWDEGEADNDGNPVGTAIREERPIVVHGTDHPAPARWQAALRDGGFTSSIFLPLHGKEGAIGTLNIHATEADAFDVEEVNLLLELASDLAYGIRSLRETETRERFEQKLEYQTYYDALTGLPNRTLFNDRLHHAIVHSGRAGRLAAVLIFNLDRFKLINDSLGHAAGDELLTHMGRHISGCLRPGDTVARLSADQFGVVMSDVASQEDVAPVAGKLLEAAARPLTLGGHNVSSSASIGISLFPRDADEAGNLLMNAEAAMYNAKSQGGGAFRFFAPEMNENLTTRLALEADLRHAIEQGELLLHFQPRVNLRSGLIVGAEALVRWQHPEKGLVPPMEFIPLAEETGLILHLDEWVINATCRQLRIWLDAGLSAPAVAVNLSARQFHQANLARMILHALNANELEAKYLELEITEGTAMLDLEATDATLRELRGIGLKLALDDFGTGYSSLAYLKRFPIDHLKIDRAFVRDLTTDPDDAAICIAVIALAHSLRLSVIAEGVETEGQMNYLRRHACDDIQGFYFSKPLPAGEFSQLLATWKLPAFAAVPEEQQALLVVDDEENILNAVKRLLRREGYRVLTAGSAREGFEVLATHDVQVVLSDQRMPEMNGTEFLSRVRDLYPETIRIVLSGYTELNSITDAVNRGAIYKFLTKPWEDEQLREQVREAFQYHAMRRKG